MRGRMLAITTEKWATRVISPANTCMSGKKESSLMLLFSVPQTDSWDPLPNDSGFSRLPSSPSSSSPAHHFSPHARI